MKRIKVGWTAVLRSLPQRRIVGCALLGAVAPGLVVLAAVFAPASQGVRIGLEDTLHEMTLATPRAASAAASEAVRSLQVLQPLPTAGERRQVASLSLMDPLEATAERTVRADQGMNLWAYSTMTTLILARPYHLNTVDGSPGADGAPTRLGKLAANLAQEKFPRVPAADKASAKDWQKALDFVWTDPASADNLKEAKSDLKALGISYNTSGVEYAPADTALVWRLDAKAGVKAADVRKALLPVVNEVVENSGWPGADRKKVMSDTGFQVILKETGSSDQLVQPPQYQLYPMGCGDVYVYMPAGQMCQPMMYSCSPCDVRPMCQPCGGGLFRGFARRGCR